MSIMYALDFLFIFLIYDTRKEEREKYHLLIYSPNPPQWGYLPQAETKYFENELC